MNPVSVSTIGAIATFSALSYYGPNHVLPARIGYVLASTADKLTGGHSLGRDIVRKPKKWGDLMDFDQRQIKRMSRKANKVNWETVGMFGGLVAVGAFIASTAASGTTIRP